MKSIAWTASLALLTMTAPALAWNDEGHMMVAASAYDQLTAKTKARVVELLALSKYPTNGVNNAKPADAAKAAFMVAATAPDAIKKSTAGYTNDGEDPTKAPDAAANVGFSDMFMHKYWHYVDLPFSTDHTTLVQPPTINVVERIGLFRKTIASTAADPLKAYDLVWLLHLVGDVHQPLHATSRFIKTEPKGDSGGNDVKLHASGQSELHAFWDDVAGKSENVSAALTAANALPKAKPTKAAVSDENVWAQESLAAAEKTVYAAPIGDTLGPYTLTAKYKSAAKTVAMQRISLAGARLANLLNNELK